MVGETDWDSDVKSHPAAPQLTSSSFPSFPSGVLQLRSGASREGIGGACTGGAAFSSDNDFLVSQDPEMSLKFRHFCKLHLFSSYTIITLRKSKNLTILLFFWYLHITQRFVCSIYHSPFILTRNISSTIIRDIQQTNTFFRNIHFNYEHTLRSQIRT